jgi:hypothetical protein
MSKKAKENKRSALVRNLKKYMSDFESIIRGAKLYFLCKTIKTPSPRA